MWHDFMNTRNQENVSITLNKTCMPPCLLFHVILEILILYSIYPNVLSEKNILQLKCGQKYKTLPRL